MTWRVALSLDQLLVEINKAAPDRSTVSDGSIGDPAHSSRESDHNPNPAGVVRARDFTHDPAHGCDAGVLAERIRRLALEGHPALGSGAYVIWSGRIASATQDGDPWDWETYFGSNPHDHHVHVSVATAAAGYDSTAPWGVTEEDHMNREQDARLERVENKLDRLDDVVRVKLTRTNERLQRANERLLRLITVGRATRADLEDLAADLADDEQETP
jgi:hypothetical protein